MQRSVPDTVELHLNGTALGDIALQPDQERPPSRPSSTNACASAAPGCATEEGRKLHQVDAVLAFVVMKVAATLPHAAVPGRRIGHGALGRRIARLASGRIASHVYIFWAVRPLPWRPGFAPAESILLIVFRLE